MQIYIALSDIQTKSFKMFKVFFSQLEKPSIYVGYRRTFFLEILHFVTG